MIHYAPKNGAQLLVLDQAEAAYYDTHGGAPERPLFEWVREWIPKDKTFVDVGAHCGTWSLNLASSVPHVEAFEAQRATFYQLCGGIVLNDLQEKVTAHHAAIGIVDEKTVELRIISRDGGGSSIVTELPTYQAPLKTETCPAARLDSFGLRDVGFVKIDTEGGEELVLRGAIGTLEDSAWPTLLFESWLPEWHGEWARPIRQSLLDYLAFLGYRIVAVTGYPEQFLAEKAS